jgi:hypothetical protein
MMFLLQCLWIVVAAYACGALVAEVLMRSDEERALPPAARALFGFLILVTWFAGAWQFLSIGQSWLLGAAVIALLGWGRVRLADLRASLQTHARGCAAVLAGALLFFAPLIVANDYGPFSESSGDLTIYSDGSKLMVERGLTSFGQRPEIETAGPNLRALFDFRTANRFARYADLRDRLLDDFRARIDPPSAEYGANRLVANLFFSSIYYAPYAALHPLAGTLDYPAFFGVEAFFYATMLLCVWYFFRPFGLAPARIALVLVAASHSLVSVWYNAYSMQAISLAICAAFLLASTRVALFTRAGLRVYGFAFLIVWLCYTHFMSILAPVAMVAALLWLPRLRPALPAAPMTGAGGLARIGRGVGMAVAFVAIALLFIGGSAKAFDFVSGLFMNFALGVKSEYLGDRIPVLSWQWLSFLFGLVSQQHLPPFVIDIPFVWMVYSAGVATGVAAAVLGLAAMARWVARPAGGSMARPVVIALYGALLVTIAAHLYLAQGSLYTQAKGAQNLLVCLYAALVFPLAVIWTDARFAASWLRRALAATLCALAMVTLLPRLLYGYNLGHNRDRAAVMDASYFDEAERILAADRDAFVLFEPRKSADLYLGIQPFSGARMVPTRHLVLDRLIFEGRNIRKARTSVAEMIKPADVPHLWWLSKPKGAPAWHAERIADGREPRFFVTGDDYELGFGPRPRGPAAGGTGTFSYVRNADLMLFLPAGRAAAVELRIEARDAADRENLMRWLERDAAPGATVERDGNVSVIRRRIAAAPQAQVVRLAGAFAEFWVNARVNDAEIK